MNTNYSLIIMLGKGGFILAQLLALALALRGVKISSSGSTPKTQKNGSSSLTKSFF